MIHFSHEEKDTFWNTLLSYFASCTDQLRAIPFLQDFDMRIVKYVGILANGA